MRVRYGLLGAWVSIATNTAMEGRIAARLPGYKVTIHMEPCERRERPPEGSPPRPQSLGGHGHDSEDRP